MFCICTISFFYAKIPTKKGGANKMEDRDMFLKIHENETNENTALILMLSIINENLKKIIELLKQPKKENVELTPEDYME